MSKPTPPVPYGQVDFDHEDSNPSSGPHFNDVLSANLQRRKLLQGGLGAAVAAGLFGTAGVAHALDPARGPNLPGRPNPPVPGRPGHPMPLSFTAVPVSRTDGIVVPPEYVHEVILPWGEPIAGRYPAYRDGGLNTGAEQEDQVGMHHDGMHFFPIRIGRLGPNRHGLMVMNHEYIDQAAMHPNGPTLVNGVRDADEVRKEIAAHGVSVVEIAEQDGRWKTVRGRYNRRITAATPMAISGPARGHAKMRTAYSPDGTRTRGTINNCAHGITPWGTYLTCEENWAGYFVDRGTRPREHSRYGVATANGRYRWETVEPRFNATATAADARGDFRNEPNTFGWIVEIDPFDCKGTPVKRTALGRFAHEGVIFGNPKPGQRLAFYSGDDATNEYIYKFVTADRYVPGIANGRMLDRGTLYVARFNDDGSGQWLALDINDPAFRAAAAARGVEFADQGDVLINTRLAADCVGATRMDRPEWGAVDPKSDWVYFTLTNNNGRSATNVDEANPRGPNPFGHIIRFREDGGRAESTRFAWDIFALAGPQSNSLDPNLQPLTDENIFASPDGLWFDSSGLLWIQTDMSGSQLNSGPFGNNAMLAADTGNGRIKRFLVGPNGCEVTGVVSTPDRRTLFVNIQHPGEGGGSAWPSGGSKPRSATVVVRRRDGGIVGT